MDASLTGLHVALVELKRSGHGIDSRCRTGPDCTSRKCCYAAEFSPPAIANEVTCQVHPLRFLVVVEKFLLGADLETDLSHAGGDPSALISRQSHSRITTDRWRPSESRHEELHGCVRALGNLFAATHLEIPANKNHLLDNGFHYNGAKSPDRPTITARLLDVTSIPLS